MCHPARCANATVQITTIGVIEGCIATVSIIRIITTNTIDNYPSTLNAGLTTNLIQKPG
jgi:hypothetical protein